jgi:V/A-type H+-transporting ATPase subunit F
LEIVCIGDVDFISGFGLGGVPRLILHESYEKTLKHLRELFDDPRVGLIILPHKIAAQFSPELKELRRKKPVPVILAVPDKSGWKPEIDELRELIKRTVGAEVVIKGGE